MIVNAVYYLEMYLVLLNNARENLHSFNFKMKASYETNASKNTLHIIEGFV